MSVWPHLLRLSLMLCWLMVLSTFSAAAVAEDNQDQSLQIDLKILRSLPKEKQAIKPASIPPALIFEGSQPVDEPIILSPHRLPSEDLEAIFPGALNAEQAIEQRNIQDLEKPFVLSPHRLPPEELEAIFPTPPDLVASDVEENVQEKDSQNEKGSEISGYRVSPRTIPLESLSPSGTQFQLNRQSLNHLTDVEIQTGYEFSNDINSTSQLSGTVRLFSELQRSITGDRKITVEHKGTYFQAETITQSREVSVARTSPQTINGFGIQLSMTGACLFEDTTPEERCSYTPSLSTADVENVLDLGDAGRLQDDGKVGEVASRESLEAIEQPGFQRGANGQALGIDLLFANTGTRPGNRFSEVATVDRTETSEIAPTFTLARRRQVVQMNDQEAVLGVTLRGNTWIAGDDNSILNALVQAGAVLLPDVTPQISGSQRPANASVNRNLFLAANNVRLPRESFTLYHGGIGKATSIEPGMQPKDMPPARFRGVWLGLSPVKDYEIINRAASESLGPIRATRVVGAEGGGGNGRDRNLQFDAFIDGSEFTAENIQDTYIQIYQSIYETDAQTINIENYTEKATYYPHLSLTGNRTSFNNVLNYYAGAIVEDNLNMYAGLDYTHFSPNGLTYSAGGVIYMHPDRDYYSQVSGSVAKRFQLSKRAIVSLSSGFNWALDRSDQIGDIEVNSRSSAVYVTTGVQLGKLSLEARGNVGGILPNSARNSLRLQTAMALTKAIKLSGFMTPLSESSSYARYGASLSWQIAGHDSPTLKAGWTNSRYGYGTDRFNNDISTSEDLFVLSLQI